MPSRQVDSDGVGGVAVQAVAGVVVPAGGAGVFVAGVVLDVAQGGAGVQGEGDRRMAQRVRRQLLPRADPGPPGIQPVENRTIPDMINFCPPGTPITARKASKNVLQSRRVDQSRGRRFSYSSSV